MDLYEKLKELREKNGFTQEEIAQLLNISRQSVSKWERGITSPDIKSLFKLSKLYNVTMESMLDSEELIDFNTNINTPTSTPSSIDESPTKINIAPNINIPNEDTPLYNTPNKPSFLNSIKNALIERHRRHIEYHKQPGVNITIFIIWAVIFIVIIICSTITSK